jgi:hypothetical protein
MVSANSISSPSQILHHIAAALEECKLPSGKGFRGIALDYFMPLMMDMPYLREIRAESDQEFICRSAAFKAAQETITAETLDQAIAEGAAAFRAKVSTPFAVLTTLSVRLPRTLHRTLGPWDLALQASIPEGFENDCSPQATSLATLRLRSRGPWVVIRGSGRSAEEMAHRGMDALDVIRGAWNLGINSSLLIDLYGYTQGPINKIRLGPLHTLHEPEGKLLPNFWMFDPAPSGLDSLGQGTADWDAALSMETRIEPIHQQTGIAHFFQDALGRYARALDDGSSELVFVRLSGLLERLLGTWSDRDMFRRIRAVSQDPIDLALLESMRNQRHESVHHGDDSPRRHSSVLVVHRYVLGLFELFVQRHASFKSEEDFWRLLDALAAANRMQPPQP